MPGTPNEVNNILWTEFGWVAVGDIEQPDPEPVAEALLTSEPWAVAQTLDSKVRGKSQTDTPPPGIEVWGEDGMYLYTRHAVYSGSNHYRKLDTAQALGLQPPDVPVPSIGQARTVTQWWDHQNHLCNRLGEPLCDEAQFATRNARANAVPLEWLAPNLDVMGYKLLCRESDPGPGPVKSYYGLSAQQILDNAWTPGTWAPTKPVKP